VARHFVTGAPGQGTCGSAGCHGGGQYSTDIFLEEVINGAHQDGTYLRGHTYAFVVSVLSPDTFASAGAQLTIFDSAGRQGGLILPPNTTSTPVANRFNWYGQLYAEHDRPIVPTVLQGNSRAHLGVTWLTGPLQGGPMHIYTCAAVCDGDGTPSGDVPMCASLVLNEAQPLVLPGAASPGQLSRRQYWLLSWPYLSGYSGQAQAVQLDIYTLQAQEIHSQAYHLPAGPYRQRLAATLAAGAYVCLATFSDGSQQRQAFAVR
jgi:hypothetical protein